MRFRATLLVFASLLLLASLPSAAAPAGLSSPAADVAPSPEDASCDPLLAELGISAIDPTATAEGAFTVCGGCSATICQGATYNAVCQVSGGLVKRCIAAYATFCSADGLPHCYCWGGPLP